MVDALIIGSGAGGAPLAYRLSQAGFTVLVLEKGPRFGRSDFVHDEPLANIDAGGFVPPVADDPHVLVDSRETHAGRRTALGWIACCVGGGTSHMGASLMRFHPDDFRIASTLGPFESCADWPYGYDALEPYYSEAEWLVGVSGAGGTNAFEGHRSRGYPMPPLVGHPAAAALDAACASLGLQSFPMPRAINSIEYAGRPACSACDFCSGFGCPTGARGSMHETLIPYAEATGRCTVRANAMAVRVTLDDHGKVSGCLYVDREGRSHLQPARVVFVCCSAIETARLLLLSTSRRFPDGLANDSGLVGQFLQLHASSSGRGRFRLDAPGRDVFHDRHPFLHRAVMDHYFLPPTAVVDWPKGGVFRFDMETLWPMRVAQQVAFSGVAGAIWGTELKRRLKEHFTETRGVDFEVFHDFVPNPGTHVTLDADVKDKWGLPVARMTVRDVTHHRIAGEWLVQRGLEILSAMGAESLRVAGTGYTNWVMTHGTCRAGRDPRSSVLNAFCQAHAVPNLFVVDGSFMPTSGGAPSTLTIIANSLRTADYVIDRARTGEII